MTQTDLDALADENCGNPTCQHCLDGVLYITGRCHAYKNAGVRVEDRLLIVSCLDCQRLITKIELAVTPDPAIEAKSCHAPGFSVSYLKTTKLLTLKCSECEKILHEMLVAGPIIEA